MIFTVKLSIQNSHSHYCGFYIHVYMGNRTKKSCFPIKCILRGQKIVKD